MHAPSHLFDGQHLVIFFAAISSHRFRLILHRNEIEYRHTDWYSLIHMSIYEHYANRQASQHILIIGHELNIDPGINSFITEKDQFFLCVVLSVQSRQVMNNPINS